MRKNNVLVYSVSPQLPRGGEREQRMSGDGKTLTGMSLADRFGCEEEDLLVLHVVEPVAGVAVGVAVRVRGGLLWHFHVFFLFLGSWYHTNITYLTPNCFLPLRLEQYSLFVAYGWKEATELVVNIRFKCSRGKKYRWNHTRRNIELRNERISLRIAWFGWPTKWNAQNFTTFSMRFTYILW